MPVVANHPDYLLSVFNTVPDNYLLLRPDSPRFSIVAATDSYTKCTNTKRQELTGLGIFEAFTDDTSNFKATGVKNLRASLDYVVKNKKEHRLSAQRYDIYNSQEGLFEVKVWNAINKPVLIYTERLNISFIQQKMLLNW